MLHDAAMHRCVFLLLVLLFFRPAFAEEWRVHVVRVLDGDSFQVVDETGQRHGVRIAHIDAPEHGQPHSQASRRHLSSLVMGQAVRLVWHKRDVHGRLLARVFVRRADCAQCTEKDAGLSQLEAGMAWWYRAFRREQTPEEQGYYEYAEFDARMRKLGLWAIPDPVAPWLWRSKQPRV